MRSFNSSLLLLAIFLCFSHNLFHLVRSDQNLINTLCGKTEETSICTECLKSDPKSNSADGKGLALIALGCAEKDTTYLHEDSLRLIQTSDTIVLKNILDGCATHSFMAQQKFSPVARYVQQGNYGAAKDIITGDIIPLVNYCLEMFNDAPNLAVPQQVLAGSVASNQTCKNAAGILSNL
ncbi:Pectinesterase inhibitor domain [Sesbania bispinosa]|nr:Pectinesterase inhibitor domain [Sesbania bispinosa]